MLFYYCFLFFTFYFNGFIVFYIFKVKVVSIFGNTGEGKSYTMNHVFFNGEEIFKTSPSQMSCTMGVWAKYDPNLNVICLDTEGLLGKYYY